MATICDENHQTRFKLVHSSPNYGNLVRQFKYVTYNQLDVLNYITQQ